jgi:Predicted unusual protein kinase
MKNVYRHITSSTFKYDNIKKNINNYKYNYKYIIGGLGGLSLASGVGYFYYKNPNKIVDIMAVNVKKTFDKEHNVLSKIAIFLKFPEPKIYIPPLAIDDSKANLSIEEWHKIVSETYEKLNKSKTLGIINYMQKTLISRINDIEDPILRIQGLKAAIPDSLELRIEIEHVLSEIMKNNEWINKDILEEACTIESQTIHKTKTKLLQYAFLCFPIMNNITIFDIINNESLLDKYLDNFSKDKKEKIKSCIEEILTYYKSLDPLIQEIIQFNIFMTVINHYKKTKENKKKFKKLIKEKLGKKLDFDIIKPYVNDLINVFLDLPPSTQAKMLICCFKNYDNMKLLKELIKHGGIVFIKIAQIISENPQVPLEYRKLLSSFKDSNTKKNILEFWKNIPLSLRCDEIEKLGICIGVGSIKQVHLVKLKGNTKPQIIGLINSEADDNTISVLKALKNIELVSNLDYRIKRGIFHELNLWNEYEAFLELNKSQYSKNSNIELPKVYIVSSQCIIRDYVKGLPLSKMPAENFVKEELLEKLLSLYNTTISASFGGYILSDLHLANIIYCNDNKKLVLFDPGQNEKIKNDEMTVLLWILVCMSKKKYMPNFKNKIIEKMLPICSSTLEEKKIIEIIGNIYNDVHKIDDEKERILTFFSKIESNNITLPHGFYSFIKMIDNVMSQQKILNINDNMCQERIKNEFLNRLTYYEYINFICNYLLLCRSKS